MWIPIRRRLKQFAYFGAVLVLAACSSGGSSSDGDDGRSSEGYETVVLEAGPELEFRIREAIFAAQPGTIIELPAGLHEISSELIVDVSHITLRGQGMDQTVLSFANQAGGAQGILVVADAFVAEDFAVEDPPGDGIRVEGSDSPTFRRVRVEWTGGPSEFNGAYGLYPVQCSNVLVEDSVVIGASDAGIYVGQSTKIIVRRNRVEQNVAGIEIENSTFADVYENFATGNTGGILVFDLPNLEVSGGQATRIFDNQIIANNTENFAPEGNIVGGVPAGVGIMVMANDDIEIFDNTIRDNFTAGIAIVSYLINQIPITDPTYEPTPERIYAHDNLIQKSEEFFLTDNDLSLLLNLLFRLGDHEGGIPDMVYDGIGERMFGGDSLPDDRKICLRDNTHDDGAPSSFVNLDIDPTGELPLPRGPISVDLGPHDCAHASLGAVRLDKVGPIPPPSESTPEEEVERRCSSPGEGVNRLALSVDCPLLSDYRLFENAADPRHDPLDGGLLYDLTTPLFSDYAEKDRFVFLPPGEAAVYDDSDVFDFPVGTVIAKTFSFADDLRDPMNFEVIETRILIHREREWVGRAYIWNEEIGDAELAIGGGARQVSWIDAAGESRTTRYEIPSVSQCSSCHDGAIPIGPSARLLNRSLDDTGEAVNQLTNWTDLGLLVGAPDPTDAPRLPVWDDPSDGSLEERARAYLETNCVHCHSENGRARSTGLFLEADRPFGSSSGLCKPPVAAGPGAGDLDFDIVPGKPEESIMIFRMDSVDPAIKMPELAKSIVHDEGLAVVADWITSLPGDCDTVP